MTSNQPHFTQETFKNWRKKTLFLAKRGNLETELLLTNYIHQLDEHLSKEKANLIRKLLNENDQNLFCWLMAFDPKRPHATVLPPTEYQSLIHKIRTNYLK